ncbi:MAG: C-terminal target protein, partial [Chitinophagaceae bacterium]|nr:C-terminal target protein [Chitinophagaceae bacterium]
MRKILLALALLLSFTYADSQNLLDYAGLSSRVSDIAYTKAKLSSDYRLKTLAGAEKSGPGDKEHAYKTNAARFTTAGPANISNGILMWLDASDVDADNNPANDPVNNQSLNRWKDKSGLAHDATTLAGQNNVVFNTNQINGKAVVHFTRVDDSHGSVLEAAGVDIRAGANSKITMFTVYKPATHDGSGQGQALWGNDNGAWDRFYYDSWAGTDDGIVSLGPVNPTFTNVTGAGAPGSLHLLTAVYDNITPNGSAIYFNGAVVTIFTDHTDSSAAQHDLRIGFDGDNGNYNGDIAEMIVYNRVLTECEIQQVNQYLAAKYGVAFTSATITAGGPTSICAGNFVTLTASNGASFQWYKDGVIIPGATAQGYNASQTGSYTVTITSFNNCTASSGATTITVNPLPIVTASSNSPVQQGQSIFLNAVGALNYFWTGPNSFIANNQQNVSIPNAQTALAGTYTVKGQDANGCSATASVNIVVGPPAGALDFDGVNDYVRIANPYTSFDKELTVEWSVLIDPSSAVGSGISQSLENIEGANSLVWMMHFNGDPASPAIQFFVSDNGTWKNADAPVPAGWHRFVGTASASGIRIYMDGNLIATSPGIVNNILNVSNAVIHFGKDSRYPDRWMKGQMDEIRIWNRALCQSELQNSNSCEYQGPQNGLVEYYKFNQGVVGVNNAGITLLPDLSSNGRDGLLNNFTLNGAASNWVSGVISGVCSVYDPFNPPIYGGSVTFCMPGSLNMFTDPIAGATYQWFRNGNPIAGETQSSYFISQPSQSGVYKVQVTLADGCSGTSHTETVKVNPLPAVFDITGSGAYCANTPTGVAVGLSGSEVGVMYQLKSGVANIGGAVAGTGGPLSFGNQLMGSYSVTATGAGNCAQGMRGVANVTTNPPPPAFINNGPSGTQCQGGTVRLSAPTGPGGFLYNYAWSNNQNGQFIDVTTGGTYTVTVTDPNTGCSSTSAPFTVVFNPLPIVFNVTGGGGYCVNTSTGVAVGLSGSQVGVNYQLKSGPNNIGAFVAGTGNAISFGNKLIGNYSVVAINPVTNCSQNMNGNVNVNNFPLPPAFINSSPAQCQGGTVRLSAPTGPGGSLYNYLWSNNQNGQFIDVTTGGTYTVTVTDPNTTCSSTSAPLTVTFNPRPTVFNVTGGGGYCANTPTAVAVGLTGSEVGVNYQLMSGGNNIGPFVAGTGNAISFGNKLSGNYSVVATNPVTNCSQNMNGNANVNIFPTPPAFITNSSPVTQCQGATVTLSAPTGPGGFLYNYLWSNNQTGQSINVTTGGTYTVTVTDPGTSCSATSAPLTVTFSPLPTVSTSFINVTCVGANNGSITVTAQGAGPFTYSKDGGTTFQPSNTFTGLPPGNYNVVVKGVCTSSPQAVTITTVADVIPPTLTLNSVGGSLTSLSGLNTYPTNVSGGALRHGHGIAYDLQRNTVWVTDNELNNDVFEFAATQPAGTTLTPLTRFHAPVTTTIEGIAFDATDNTLWIVDFNGVILHIDRSNNTLSGGFNVSATIPSATFGATGLGIALQDNFIWIDNGVRAYKFNKSGGAYTGFSFATGQPGITYDPERHVLWSSGWYDGIYRAFDPATGNLVFTSGVISFPQGHDVSIGAGRIWIVSENDTNDKIYSIGINGGSIDQIVEC